VEICAVTAISSPDGTAARNIQRPRKIHDGAGASLSSSGMFSFAACAGERSSRTPQVAISTIKRP
jgi:hypothetical protein